MQAHDMTDWHRADLAARTARARAEVETRTSDAQAFGETAPEGYDANGGIRIWNKAGRYAVLFCIWFVFIAPIVMVLHLWE